MTLLVIKTLTKRFSKSTRVADVLLATLSASSNSAPDDSTPKDKFMSDKVDNWHKLARYDTNMQGELHANLLRNNGITVSLQALSAIPGMNSGIVLWVQDTDLMQAQRILNDLDSDRDTETDGEILLNSMSDAELGIEPDKGKQP